MLTQPLPLILFLGIILPIVLSQSGSQTVDVKRYKTCIEKWKKKNERLAGRFKDTQIAWFCEKSRKWNLKAKTRPDISLDSRISSKQKGWLRSLRRCQGADCISAVNVSTRADVQAAPIAKSLPIVNPAVEAFDILELSRINLKLIPIHPDDGPDMSLLDSSSSKACEQRSALAIGCPLLAKAKTAQEQFSGKVAEIMQKGGFSMKRKLQRLENKFNGLKTKCSQIMEALDSRKLNFNDLSCNDWSDKQKKLAQNCIRVLDAADAGEAFPSMKKRLQKLKKKAAQEQLQEQMVKKFDNWTDGCLEIQEKLSAKGDSFDSWLLPPNEKPRFARQVDSTFRGMRTEYRMMSDEERWRFQDALNELKHEVIDGQSKYDLLIMYHTPSESPGAHWGPAFLPFHREWLKQLEIALRQIDPEVSLPYWDSTLDQPLPDSKDSILWTDEFFGNGDGEVTTGPFAGWQTTHELGFVPGMKRLYRDVGKSPFGELYTEDDVNFSIDAMSYDDLTACVDPTFELVTGVVHMYVGGFMGDIAISPNDPVYIAHHTFIDYLWEEFRQVAQSREERETAYPTDDMSCNEFHYGEAQMKPFPIKNIDGMSNSYTDDIYQYEPRITCSEDDPDCLSPYLYCDIQEGRCLSKIRPWGNCQGYEGEDICLDSTCSWDTGICESDEPQTTRPPATTTTKGTVTDKPEPIPQWEEWSAWSECSQTCDEGVRIRDRFCDTTDACDGGKDVEEQTEPCTLMPCPTQPPHVPQWEPWSTWSECSQTCDEGVRIRDRICDTPDSCNGKDEEEQTEACFTMPCPTAAPIPQWEPWSSWSECSQTCDEGVRIRDRICDTPDSCNGKDEEEQTEACFTMPCPTAAPIPQWEPWSSWSECSQTCDEGVRIRDRICDTPDGCNGKDDEEQTEACFTMPCPTAAPLPQWEPWSTWSECSQTCNEGVRIRDRLCDSPIGCNGRDDEEEACFIMPCPTAAPLPQWEPWSTWSECSQTCDEGVRTRDRICDTPDGCNGKDDEEQTESCFTMPCPTEPPVPQWETWAAWSECSQTCDEGLHTRERLCEVADSCDGRDLEVQTEGCITMPCPTTPTTTKPVTHPSGDKTTPGNMIGPQDYVPFPAVWFTISVVRGPEFRSQRSRTPVPGANIWATGLNVPRGYTETLEGIPMEDDEYPYYSTGALVRVRDPKDAGSMPISKFSVNVIDENGVECVAHCYDFRRRSYKPCSNEVRLSTRSGLSDPVTFRKAQRLVLKAVWSGRGSFKRRKEDHLMFVCP